jgi:hypothetical protein
VRSLTVHENCIARVIAMETVAIQGIPSARAPALMKLLLIVYAKNPFIDELWNMELLHM